MRFQATVQGLGSALNTRRSWRLGAVTSRNARSPGAQWLKAFAATAARSPGGLPPRRPRGRRGLDGRAVVCDTTTTSSTGGTVPRHLDTIVNVPAPSWDAGDPRAYSVSDTANAWRLDATVLSVVLTVQSWASAPAAPVSAWWRRTRLPVARVRDQAALSIGSQARPRFRHAPGSPSIQSLAAAACRPVTKGLSRTPAPVAAEIARLALFLPPLRLAHHRPDAASAGALAHFG